MQTDENYVKTSSFITKKNKWLCISVKFFSIIIEANRNNRWNLNFFCLASIKIVWKFSKTRLESDGFNQLLVILIDFNLILILFFYVGGNGLENDFPHFLIMGSAIGLPAWF